MSGVLRRVLVLGALLVAGLVGIAGTASAHAQLEGGNPAAGAVVPVAPSEVTLTFGEPVDIAAGSMQVLDDHLRRVDRGDLSAVDAAGSRIRVTLRDGLAAGTYTVSYRVTSADTHPVSGTYTFSIGAASTVTGAVPGSTGGGAAAGLLDVARGLSYAGLALGPGALLVLLLLWPEGLADPRARRLVATGVGVLTASTLGGMLLQGIWASGLPLSALWSSTGALDTHSRRFDLLYAVRAYLGLALGALLYATVLTRAHPVRPTRSWQALGTPARPAIPRRAVVGVVAAAGLGLLGTWSLTGHAAAGPQSPLAVAVDLAHLAAMALWLGGLALLAVTLARQAHATDLAVVLPRFSRLAMASVAVLVVTGSYQAWREVGSLAALTGTAFGRLLLVKLVGVAVLLGMGALARRWVARHTAPARRLLAPRLVAHASGPGLLDDVDPAVPSPDVEAVRSLRRGLLVELLVAAAVLGLTAVLVATVPGRQAYVAPVDRSVTVDATTVDVHIDAPRVGDGEIRLAVHRPDGTPVAVQDVSGTVALPSAGLGPLPLRVLPGTDATRPVLAVSFPAAGEWTVQMSVRTGPLDAVSVTVPVPVTAGESA